MKKIYYFIMICLWILGVIGGIGYALYCSAWSIAVAIAATGFMAWPTVKEYFNNLVLR